MKNNTTSIADRGGMISLKWNPSEVDIYCDGLDRLTEHEFGLLNHALENDKIYSIIKEMIEKEEFIITLKG